MAKSRKKIKPRPVVAVKTDAEKTLEDWGKATREVLQLKCNQYTLLATGNRHTLGRRLYAFFHPSSPPILTHAAKTELLPLLQIEETNTHGDG